MDRIVYLNGQFIPADHAAVSPFDRGFLFSDGVYEVVRYYGGRPFVMPEHLKRLADSMASLRLTLPADHPGFDVISDELIRRNGQPDAYVYWQVTRGAAEREHRFPEPSTRPTTFAFTKPMPPLDRHAAMQPMKAITHPETRWARCAIKSVSLLPNVLAAETARQAGADEAIFIRNNGTVTEGTARSIFAVIDGTLRVHPLDGSVLPSISREIVLGLALDCDLAVDQSAFSRRDMACATEVFAVGTTTEIRPILRIDDQAIRSGEVGPITRQLADALRRRIIADCRL
jgi:D-alanine transaminase